MRNAELEGFIENPESMSETIRERGKEFRALSDLQDPFIINGDVPPLSQWSQRGSTVEPAEAGESSSESPEVPEW